jgi:antitoxin (DNA-binding transcriptional repressor) of toxin-antitoxin stability system
MPRSPVRCGFVLPESDNQIIFDSTIPWEGQVMGMVEMTVTAFSRKLRNVFDRIEHGGEEIVLVRNNHAIARIMPGSPHMSAREVMSDLYRTIPDTAGKTWVKESRVRGTVKTEIQNKWDS